MAILDSVKNLFIEQVDEPVVENKPTAMMIPPAIVNSTPSPTFGSEKIVEIDTAIKSKLTEAIKNCDPKLYYDLNDMISTLADDIPSLAARYKTAIKLLVKKGATPLSIISDYDKCISALETKSREFTDAISKKLQEKIENRNIQIDNLDKSIKNNNNKIVELQAQISKLQNDSVNSQSQKDTLQNEIVSENSLMKLKQDRFAIVYNSVSEELKSQKESVKNYSA